MAVVNTARIESSRLEEFFRKESKTMQEFYWANYKKAEVFILKNSGSSTEAKDVFQESVLEIYKRIMNNKFVPKNIQEMEAYLFQIMKYKWFHQLKKYKREQNTINDLQKQTSSNPSFVMEIDKEQQERINILSETLQDMDDPCHAILKGVYYQKMSYNDLAKKLDYSADSLKTMKYRCMKKLRKLMQAKLST